FQQAKLGLFIHYALASVLERGKPGLIKLAGDKQVMDLLMEHVEHLDKAAPGSPSAAAALRIKQDLFNRFTASSFDADAFCDLAEAAGMKYITLTTKHLGGLYLFRTKTTRFNSVRSPAKRDLVDELAQACRKRGLGLFLYVPPEFARTDAGHLEHNRTVLRELLTQYGPIAGIWFDGIGPYHNQPGNYTRLSETYAMVRSLQPHCLISFKDGAIGEEDFRTPEHFLLQAPYQWKSPKRQKRWNIRLARWQKRNTPEREKLFGDMPAEINSVMLECNNRDGVGEPGGWINDEQARHLSAGEVMDLVRYARAMGANLLMNIGPRGDGSIHPADAQALREAGRRLKTVTER
ncbi:MAG: alpha-L-fucosidase, partial [bacterium]|nr:alpha-L-fucosidase [bacterium]